MRTEHMRQFVNANATSNVFYTQTQAKLAKEDLLLIHSMSKYAYLHEMLHQIATANRSKQIKLRLSI